MVASRELQAALVIARDVPEDYGLVGPAAGDLNAVLHPGTRGHLQEPDGRDAARVVVQRLEEAVLATCVKHVDEAITRRRGQEAVSRSKGRENGKG